MYSELPAGRLACCLHDEPTGSSAGELANHLKVFDPQVDVTLKCSDVILGDFRHVFWVPRSGHLSNL
jgi:hypothetical protein